MFCKKCNLVLLSIKEKDIGLCHNCLGIHKIEEINTLREMIEDHRKTKELLEHGIKIADKKIDFFTGLIKSLKDNNSTKEEAL